LDVVADLVSFLNAPNTGLWMVKNANSNQGNGITKVNDIGKYKDELLNKKDKWGESYQGKKPLAFQSESTELLINKINALI
jgi:hypothetical protein